MENNEFHGNMYYKNNLELTALNYFSNTRLPGAMVGEGSERYPRCLFQDWKKGNGEKKVMELQQFYLIVRIGK